MRVRLHFPLNCRKVPLPLRSAMLDVRRNMKKEKKDTSMIKKKRLVGTLEIDSKDEEICQQIAAIC